MDNIINFPVTLKRDGNPDLVCKLPFMPSAVIDKGTHLVVICGKDKYYVALNGNCWKIEELRKE